jgi:hypothetical protein
LGSSKSLAKQPKEIEKTDSKKQKKSSPTDPADISASKQTSKFIGNSNPKNKNGKMYV